MEKHYSVYVDELEKMLSKIQTFEKKRKTMGLTDEETTKIRTMKQEYFMHYEEMIESAINQYLLPYIHDTECLKMMDEINKLVPWSGGLIIRDTDFQEVTKAADRLTEEQNNKLHDSVSELHRRAMENLSKFANDKENYNSLTEYGKVITGQETGNIFDTISYMDSRYREFAEMMGFELADVMIYTDPESSEE